MRSGVLIDTGPLVASINRNDRYHEWARAQLADLAPPLLTCEPVITEACHLLRRAPGGQASLLEMLSRGLIEVRFGLGQHAESVARLMAKYADVPMALADACLVRMSELDIGSPVLTIDTHFRAYRQHGRKAVPVLMPPAQPCQ